MCKPIRIVFVITSAKLGGAQVHLASLIEGLPTEFEIYVITGGNGWMTERISSKVKEIFIVPQLVREVSPIKDMSAIYRIFMLIRKISPQIIHCHSSKAGVVGRIAARLCNVPAIFTAHGWAFTEGVPRKLQLMYGFLEKVMSYCSEKIICVSRYDYRIGRLVINNDKKLTVVHNGIPFCGRTNLKLPEETLKLVMVARFTPPKNQLMLIEALKCLKESGFSFKTTFVGDGEQYNKIKEIIESSNIKKDVVLLGECREIEKILSQNDIFILMSDWEGLPISIIEAMRSNMPIIASHVGGVSECVIDGVNGFLIERGNRDLLVERLRYFQQNKDKCLLMGDASRAIFEEKFIVTKMIETTVSIYNAILLRRRDEK